MYYSGWEPGDWLFLTHLLPEPAQVDLRAIAITSQHLAKGAKCSMEIQAITAQLPTYVAEF